jgi:integrase
MAIRKIKRTDKKTGEITDTKSWFLFFSDHQGIPRSFSVGTDKESALSIDLWMRKLVACRQSKHYPLEIQVWIDAAPNRLKQKFVKWDLVSGCRVAVTQPLKEHLLEWHKTLKASGITKKQADQLLSRVNRMFDECNFVLWPDISASKLTQCIDGVQKTVLTKEGIKELGPASEHTKRHFVRACKQFCKWAVQDGRANTNPIEYISRSAAVETERRALIPAEIEVLLEYIGRSDSIFKLSGEDRALLYRFAIETGLRADEIRSLTRLSFDFERRTVSVASTDTKNKKPAVLPLKVTMVEDIKEKVRNLLPTVAVFRVPENSARMLQKDLQETRKKWIKAVVQDPDEHRQRVESDFLKVQTVEGKIVFHSLRHTFSSLLAASGVHPKIAQELMRHSSIDLTMSIYTHVQAEHVTAAVDALPEFGHRFFAKTGTDAHGEIIKNSLENSLFSPTLHGKTGQNMAIGVNQTVSFGRACDEGKTLNNNSKTKVLTGKEGSVIVPNTQASVAQLDRASVFGTEG